MSEAQFSSWISRFISKLPGRFNLSILALPTVTPPAGSEQRPEDLLCQTQHIADLEARLSELLGEQAYSRTGLGAPHNHAALEEQNQALQNEIQELQAKLQDQEKELGAAREANRQLMSHLNKTAANAVAGPSQY